MSEDDYLIALHDAIDKANKYGVIMQLRREEFLGRTEFIVTVAVQDASKRFGVDAQGEFIPPGTPKSKRSDRRSASL